MVTDGDEIATQAAPLIASPTMIVALLSPEVREATSTYTLQQITRNACATMGKRKDANKMLHSPGSLLLSHPGLLAHHTGCADRVTYGLRSTL